MIYHSRDEWINKILSLISFVPDLAYYLPCLLNYFPSLVGKHQNLVQQLQIFSQWERDCWEGKVLKDDGKFFFFRNGRKVFYVDCNVDLEVGNEREEGKFLIVFLRRVKTKILS